MINTAETIPPEELLSKINTNETIPPSETKEDTHVSLNVGESVADSYIVQSEIAGKGKQAEVYLTKRYGKLTALPFLLRFGQVRCPRSAFLVQQIHFVELL